MQCRPCSHMLSVKKHSYALFSKLKPGRRETIKTKKQKEKESSSFLFYSQETCCLKNQLKGEPQFSLKIYCQKQIAIVTQCIKNQQTKKHFFALDQKRTKKKKKRSIKNNLNRNAEAVSLRFFSKKGFLKNVIIFTEKHLCRSLYFDEIGCLKAAIY